MEISIHILKNDPLPQQIIPKIKKVSNPKKIPSKTHKIREPKTKQRQPTAARQTHPNATKLNKYKRIN